MQNDNFSPNTKIGMLGGGQLGRMFLQEALNYNADIHFLDPDKDAPCSQLSPNFTIGDFRDYHQVVSFGENLDLISIEIEQINTQALLKLESLGKTIIPPVSLIQMVQDKGLQKQFYFENNIPSAPFYLINNREEITQYTNQFPFFQKLRVGGYDGKGVIKLDNPQNYQHAFDAPSVLEKMVDFEKELSVIVARNAKGEIKTYPVVECQFNPIANLVEFLFAPASIPIELEKEATRIAVTIAEKTKLIGILAVELFLTQTGEILVNEIAPRAHNSGHHTIEANICSQYEQHFRTLFNLPLGSTDILSPSVMINLLGEPNYTGIAYYEGLEEAMKLPGVFIHLYGKLETKPFRKMGHVTVLNQDLEKAKAIAREVKSIIKIKAK